MKNAFMSKQCCPQPSAVEDVARTAAWLLSDKSSGLTGQVVNGEWRANEVTA